jgi:hypothetical protein
MRQAAEARDLGRLGAELRDEHLRATTLVGSTEQVVDQLIEALTPEVAKVTIRPVGFAGQPVAVTVARFIEEVRAGGATPILVTCIAFLMVSRIPYRRLSRAYLVGRQPFGQFMFVVAVFLVFISFPAPTLIFASMLYGVSGPVLYGVRLARGRGLGSAAPGVFRGDAANPAGDRRN